MTKITRKTTSMTSKSNNYIDMELEWLETKAAQIREYVDKNPFHKMKERIVSVNGKETIAATIETQQKNIRDSLKDYTLIIEAISKLREKEAAQKSQTRGDADLSPLEDGQI